MCARAKLVTDISEIKVAFRIPGPPINIPPRWNGAPTQDFAVIRRNPTTGVRSLDLLRWGLVPHWADGEKVAYATINAKSETLATTASFRDAWRKEAALCHQPRGRKIDGGRRSVGRQETA